MRFSTYCIIVMMVSLYYLFQKVPYTESEMHENNTLKYLLKRSSRVIQEFAQGEIPTEVVFESIWQALVKLWSVYIWLIFGSWFILFLIVLDYSIRRYIQNNRERMIFVGEFH